MRRCVLVTGGPPEDFAGVRPKVRPDDLVVTCDAGYAAAKRLGLRVDLAVGDFDTYRGEIDPAVEQVRLPPEKDDTDTALGIRYARARGCDSFLILGGFGGRLDHTIANVQLLAGLAAQGCACEIRADRNRAWAVHSGTLRLPRMEGWYLSVFAWEECTGVTLRGLAYPLTGARIRPTVPLGVSNAFVADWADITVAQGTLVVVASYEGTQRVECGNGEEQ